MKNCCCGVCCFLGVLCVAIVLCCTCFVVKNCSIDINSVLFAVIIILSVIILASVFAICFDSRSVASVKKKKIEKLEVIENFFYKIPFKFDLPEVNQGKGSEKKQTKGKKSTDNKINKPIDENLLKLIRIYCDTLADI